MSADAVDATTRQQVYIERLKKGRDDDLNGLIATLILLLRSLFTELSVSSLSDMNRVQQMAFMMRLRKQLGHAFDHYHKELMAFLKQFGFDNSDMATEIFTDITGISLAAAIARKRGPSLFGPVASNNNMALWSRVTNAIIPANGLTLASSNDYAMNAALGQLLRRVQIGIATNDENINQTLQALIGSDRLFGRDGIMPNIQRQLRANAHTAIQHVAANTTNATASLYYDEYQWCSVIDSHTTEICRSRNSKVYRYGNGPIPPAHVGCRSSVVPYSGHAPGVPATFRGWISQQPDAIRPSLNVDNPLDLEEYRRMVSQILAA